MNLKTNESIGSTAPVFSIIYKAKGDTGGGCVTDDEDITKVMDTS